MPILVSELTEPVAVTLLDEDGISYPEDELISYVNEALRATAAAKPDFYPITDTVTLVAGIDQNIPEDGVALFNIPQNATGRKRVVTQVIGGLLDEANRFWPAGTQQAEVEHFTFDPRLARQFRVYPPNNGAGQVVMRYGAVPETVDEPTDEIPVSNNYQPALIQYMLSRARDKESKKYDPVKSAAAMQAWRAALGLKAMGVASVTPKVGEQPGAA